MLQLLPALLYFLLQGTLPAESLRGWDLAGSGTKFEQALALSLAAHEQETSLDGTVAPLATTGADSAPRETPLAGYAQPVTAGLWSRAGPAL